MQYQNPFDNWENSDEYYGLQDQIADTKMQQQNFKTNFAAGMFGKNAYMLPEAKKQADMRLGEFDRRLQVLNQRLAEGKFNFDAGLQGSSSAKGYKNSDKYYGLQDQIANTQMQQQNFKTNFAAGMFGKNAHVLPEAKKQVDMRAGEFDRRLQVLNQRLGKERFNLNSGPQGSSSAKGHNTPFNF